MPKFGIPCRMSAVQIIRGTAALPPDVEERFRRAYGREMNLEERKFFGLRPEKKQPQSSEQYKSPEAA